MRVGLQRQAKVSDVLGLVHRQCLRAQQHRFQQRRVFALAHLAQQGGVVGRRHLRPGRQAQAELAQELQELGVLGFRRLVVNTIWRGNLLFQQELRGLDIGRDHAFLNQLVGIVALLHGRLHDLARRPQAELHFTGFKLDGTARMPLLLQHAIEGMQGFDVRQQAADLRAGSLVVQTDRRPHLRIGQARMRAHHRLIERRLADFTRMGDPHVADKAHAVDIRIQGTDAVGKRFRQHRHHVTRKIHRGRAVLRFTIKRRFGPHVMRHVGNRDHQTIAVTGRLAVHRIVEIASRLAVDGHQGHIAQIDAFTQLGGGNLQGHIGRLLQHRLRPDVRNVVAVNRHLDRERGRERLAQHGQNPPQRQTIRCWWLSDFTHHDLSRTRRTACMRRDQHVMLQAAIIRCHAGDAIAFLESPNQSQRFALQHFDNGSFRTTASIQSGDTGQHAIAVHDLTHLRWRQEQVVSARIGLEKAEPIRIGKHRARHQIKLARHGIATASVHQQLPVAQHRTEAFAECLETIWRGQIQLMSQGFRRHRLAVRFQVREDRLTTGNRVGIAQGLTLGQWIDRSTRCSSPDTRRLLQCWRRTEPRMRNRRQIGQPWCRFARFAGSPCAGWRRGTLAALWRRSGFFSHPGMLRVKPRLQACRPCTCAAPTSAFAAPLTASPLIRKVRDSFWAAPRRFTPAQVAELVDALVSGTSGATRGGSSPLLGTR